VAVGFHKDLIDHIREGHDSRKPVKMFHSNMASAKGLETLLPDGHLIDILVSFHGLKKLPELPFVRDIFLDSGAFSAFKSGVEIDLDKYIQFVLDNTKAIYAFAGLDVIGNAQATYENQLYVEDHGITPIPTYHYGEPANYLRRYAKYYDYIALGGVAQLRNRYSLKEWLHDCWTVIWQVDPTTRVHGFGIQDIKILSMFPWFSADATSAHVEARFGGMFTPFGVFKVNPAVQCRSLSPLQKTLHDLVAEWVESLGMGVTLEQAKATTTEATLVRAAVNVMFFELVLDHLAPINYIPRKKRGFHL